MVPLPDPRGFIRLSSYDLIIEVFTEDYSRKTGLFSGGVLGPSLDITINEFLILSLLS